MGPEREAEDASDVEPSRVEHCSRPTCGLPTWDGLMPGNLCLDCYMSLSATPEERKAWER